jgi:hypothetical protein
MDPAGSLRATVVRKLWRSGLLSPQYLRQPRLMTKQVRVPLACAFAHEVLTGYYQQYNKPPMFILDLDWKCDASSRQPYALFYPSKKHVLKSRIKVVPKKTPGPPKKKTKKDSD